MYQPRYSLQKIMWEFNPYDNDMNPHLSIPHGDDYSPKYHTLKLNVYNGCIYTSKHRRYAGKVRKKELKRLHQDPDFQKVKRDAEKYRNGGRITTFAKSRIGIYRIELESEMFNKRSNKNRRKYLWLK